VLDATGGLELPLLGALSALVARRRQVVEMLTAEKNRRGQAPPAIQADIAAHIAWSDHVVEFLDSLNSGWNMASLRWK
jgi:transposase